MSSHYGAKGWIALIKEKEELTKIGENQGYVCLFHEDSNWNAMHLNISADSSFYPGAI